MPRNRVADSPERQRKVALLNDALLKRGLQVGSLTVGSGRWSVYCWARPGVPVPEPLLNVTLRRGTFDELLALVEDDLELARFIYSQRSSEERVRHNALRSAEYQLERAEANYARAAVALVLSAIDNGGVPVGQEEHGKACSEAYAKLALARGIERQAREEFDAYHAALPTTQEEATAYLASLPIVVRN